MLQQQIHDGLFGREVTGVQPELLEVLVLADQSRRIVWDQIDDLPELGLVQRGFEVFNDIELDVSLAQDLQRAAGFASSRVVIKKNRVHYLPSFGWADYKRK